MWGKGGGGGTTWYTTDKMSRENANYADSGHLFEKLG